MSSARAYIVFVALAYSLHTFKGRVGDPENITDKP